MQIPLLPVLAVKLPLLKGGGIGPRTETSVNLGGSIALVPCLHQSNIYIKRQPGVWRDQKRIPLFGEKTPLTSAGRQTTPSQRRRHRAENGNLRKLGRINRLGTVFQQINDEIKGEPGVWRDQKCIRLVGAKTSLTCVGRQTTPSQGRRYRAENGNLRKFGRIYRVGTLFALRQYLHQKGARGMDRPEMYSFSRCKNPPYLGG